MDGLQLVSMPPRSAFRADRPKAQRGPQPDLPHSNKPCTRNFLETGAWHQSQNKVANKAARSNEFSDYPSCQSSVTCPDFYASTPKECNIVSSREACIDSSNVGKSAKKKSRQKARRKGKQNKRVSSETGSTEPEVLSEYAHGSSTSEACGYNDHGDELISSATSPEVSFPDGSSNQIDFEGEIRFSSSKVLAISTSNIDEVAIVETFEALDVSSADGSSNQIDFEGDPRFINSEALMICTSNADQVAIAQNFSSSDAQFLMSGKKGKQIKALPRSDSAHKYGGFGNLHGRAGKENNHSVWQKVQRNDADNCSTETKITPVCFQSDITLKEAPSLKRNCIVAEVNASSRTEDKKLPKDKVSKKLKRKNSLGSKQEYSYHGKGYSSNKASFNTRAKTSVQQNETSDLTVQVSDQKGGKSSSRTHSLNSCLMVGFQPGGVECVNSESFNSSQVFPDVFQQLQCTYDTVSSTRHCHTESQGSLPAKLCNSLDQNVLKAVPPVYLPHLFFNKGPQMEKENACPEYCKQNHSSGSVMQKWIPIGVRDPELASSARFGNSLPDPFDGPAGEDFTLRNVPENASFDSQDLVSSSMLDMCQVSENTICFPQEDDQSQKLKNSTGWMLEHNKKHVAAENSTSESSDQHSAFEDESIKIIQAVKDACRVQMECEAIQMATGSPVAEFERFLHFSSPVISQLPSLSCCHNGLSDRLFGVPICRHETPNIPLKCLWQWYEEHGNYGLEVRAEDFENSRSWGSDGFSFHGYFVPFLSAVQLFKNDTSQPIKNNSEAPDGGIFDTYEASESSENSKVGHLPIFSVLIPQPRTTAVAQSVDVKCSDDAELLFEYFESEQPQQRRPLYEKIQDLVRGDVSSHCKMYGDPTKLASLNLHDLHPRSWYSVAWYPIYRIPDGNFRTAFLTYHSLGHLVNRSAKSDPLSKDACVVSPVVGLQSYNAQGECWFKLQNRVNQTAGTPSLNSSVILKERLRTLAETASLMARAVVNKGNRTFVNRHPDYEFFLSRRGYSLL